MAADRTGRVLDGDELVALAAVHLRDRGRLAGNGVAMTVMTNFGFHRAMRDAGIRVTTTEVGDRYVLAALRERGYTLGGEQSGHIIELGFAPSGDGIASALLTLEALAGRELATARVFEKLPQRLINVPVGGAAASVAQSRARAGRDRARERPAGRQRAHPGASQRHRAADPGDGRSAVLAAGHGDLRADRRRRPRRRMS